MQKKSDPALEIRGAFASALVKEQIYGASAEVVQDAMCDVRADCIELGYADFMSGKPSTPPVLFQDYPCLVGGWQIGYVEATESALQLSQERELPDGDYILSEGAAWLTVKGFSVRIMSTDEGIVVDIYQNGKEAESPIAGTYAHDDEIAEDANPE